MEAMLLEQMLAKAGGKFRLVSLYQKRMRELVRGLPPLVEVEGNDPWDVTAKEILDGKAELLIGEEAEKLRRELAAREADEAPAGDKDKAKAKSAPASQPT